MPLHRTRLAVAVTSLAVIALELTLMRVLSLRFWHHFAYMIISVALLGFGASGTLLTLLRRWIVPCRRAWMFVLAGGFAASIPLCLHATARIALDAESLAWELDVDSLLWDLWRMSEVAKLEALLFVPFFLGAGVIGVALMDEPGRLSGHYAANLVGSGAGAVAAVAMMHVVDTSGLVAAVAAAACAAAVLLAPWAHLAAAAAALVLFAGRQGRRLLAAGVAVVVLWAPHEPTIPPYKALPQYLLLPGARVIHRAEGPLGRIEVVTAEGIHGAAGVSLLNPAEIPPQALLVVDGDRTLRVFDCKRREDWAFMDYTTAAVAYALRKKPSVLILQAGGGADIGLAWYHQSPRVVALQPNRQIIEAMAGPLAPRGGEIYQAPDVQVLAAEARGHLASIRRTFDVIQVPVTGGFAGGGAGLQAVRESYLYTVESVQAMLERLSKRGVLCITREAVSIPPRQGLRVFDTAAAALRREGLDPAQHLVMIRSLYTVTVLVSRRPVTPEDAAAVRAFCGRRERSFDLCYLPGIRREEVNRHHVLTEPAPRKEDGPADPPVERPYYYEAAKALLGPDREWYLNDYPFDVAAATDEKPFFFHFFRWKTLRELRKQAGQAGLGKQARQRGRAHLELGYLILLAALVQAAGMAVILILLPLVPGIGALRRTRGRAAALGYFLLLGMGFMLLEMGFLQKLILYLAHPIYSAAVVIAGFLIFAGLGSHLSQFWPGGPRRVIAFAAGAVVLLAGLYVLGLDAWLKSTQHSPMWARFLISAGVIAPLAFAMGHMFPSALRGLARSAPRLVPWAWAVNGFASVAATVGAPLLAMSVGFSRLVLIAMGGYALAGLVGARWLRGIQCRSIETDS